MSSLVLIHRMSRNKSLLPLLLFSVIAASFGHQWSSESTSITSDEAETLLAASAVATENANVENTASVDGTRVSDRFPDVPLVDQFGKTHSFRSELVKNKLCCITFFFTQCQGSCPGTIQKMVSIRKELSKLFPPEDMQFLAVSLDPEHDTIDALAEYAEQQQIHQSSSLANWWLCSGQREDLESLRIALGMYELDPVLDADRTNHAALIVFGNDVTDSWTALPSGLKTEHLVEAFHRFGR